MNKFSGAFTVLAITAPLVNFSLIPDSNLPITYLATIALLIIVVTRAWKLPVSLFGKEDLCFGAFLLVALVAFAVNYQQLPGIGGLLQIGNLAVTYLIYKMGLLLLLKSNVDPDRVLRRIFRINSFFALAAIGTYLFGLLNGPLLEKQIQFFNNSGNFDSTGVGYSFATARSFGFGPEPSFWSFFISVNIALGLIIPKASRFLLFVNIVNLILTFGRTGLLIAACVFVIRFAKQGVLQKVALTIAVLIAAFFFYDYITFKQLKSVDDSFYQRFDSLRAGLEILLSSPFLGIGLGNFSKVAEYMNLPYLDIFNLYLHLAISVGVLGLLIFLYCLYSIFKRIHPSVNLPFYAALVGWGTASAYNLPFVWITFAALVYYTIFHRQQTTVVGQATLHRQ